MLFERPGRLEKTWIQELAQSKADQLWTCWETRKTLDSPVCSVGSEWRSLSNQVREEEKSY